MEGELAQIAQQGFNNIGYFLQAFQAMPMEAKYLASETVLGLTAASLLGLSLVKRGFSRLTGRNRSSSAGTADDDKVFKIPTPIENYRSKKLPHGFTEETWTADGVRHRVTKNSKEEIIKHVTSK